MINDYIELAFKGFLIVITSPIWIVALPFVMVGMIYEVFVSN